MKGTFLIKLADITHPDFKNFEIKLQQVSFETLIAQEMRTISIDALISSLEQYQWYLNALIFIGNLEVNSNETSKILDQIKEEFLTFKEAHYLNDKIYPWLLQIEHTIAKAISDYVVHPNDFDIQENLFKPLQEIVQACRQRSSLQFYSEKAIISSFLRKVVEYEPAQALNNQTFIILK